MFVACAHRELTDDARHMLVLDRTACILDTPQAHHAIP